jgi:acyl-ACP thioesterase
MDATKRTLLRATDLKYPVEEYPLPFERTFKVIIEKENSKKLGEFIGSNYYIDENSHVNNTAYADIVNDFSTLDREIKYFDVTYEHEILENSIVEIFSAKGDNEEKLMGIRKSDDAVCFVVQIKNYI